MHPDEPAVLLLADSNGDVQAYWETYMVLDPDTGEKQPAEPPKPPREGSRTTVKTEDLPDNWREIVRNGSMRLSDSGTPEWSEV
ncbi:hypothetical protein [Haloarcula rubripromontorii]|uniref:hypothetical protein n=1 Tax=Haloarcula rubripromontorii TaxID=1705562 RepID=UPI00345BF833